MSYWNHRVIVEEEERNHKVFHIAEVHHDEDGTPTSYGKKAVAISDHHFAAAALGELRWNLQLQIQSLKEPILWGGDRFPEIYKP